MQPATLMVQFGQTLLQACDENSGLKLKTRLAENMGHLRENAGKVRAAPLGFTHPSVLSLRPLDSLLDGQRLIDAQRSFDGLNEHRSKINFSHVVTASIGSRVTDVSHLYLSSLGVLSLAGVEVEHAAVTWTPVRSPPFQLL